MGTDIVKIEPPERAGRESWKKSPMWRSPCCPMKHPS